VTEFPAPAEPVSVVVLAAGRPFRGSGPTILETLPDKRRLFEWLKDSFRNLTCHFRIVAGYRFLDIASELQGEDISFEPAWQVKGATASLLKGIASGNACYVTYADIIFRAAAVNAIEAMRGTADVIVAVDTLWRERFIGRAERDLVTAEKVVLDGTNVVRIGNFISESDADGEFIGLAHLSATAVGRIGELAAHQPGCDEWSLSELLGQLVVLGVNMKVIDVHGDWASLDEPQDIARFVHGSKAQTLGRLRRLIRKSIVPSSTVVRFDHWREDRANLLVKLGGLFEGDTVAVRSSAVSEDGWTASMAGRYVTRLGVAMFDKEELADAIDSVFLSYDLPKDADEVLVQSMVMNVAASGVVLSRTLQRGAPYYQVNYDVTTGRTDSITQGVDNSGYLVKCHHSALKSIPGVAPELASLPDAVGELTDLLGYDNLDIEFAITRDAKFNLLQVRPIAAHVGDWWSDDCEVEATLQRAEQTFANWQPPGLAVQGSRTVFSVMTDWNPAEMIGIRPRQLAFDLYRFLVTDSVWARQRAQFGYRNVAPAPLMIALAGHAYIDVRASLNSFLPDSISDALASQLIDAQMDILVESRDLHDKVEFAVATSCMDFGFSVRRMMMRNAEIAGADLDAWAKALVGITRAAMDPRQLDVLDQALQCLESRRRRCVPSSPLQAAFGLLHDCQTWGTLPFAHYARHAFIAKSLLSTASDRGIIGQNADQRFAGSLTTVAREILADSCAVGSGAITPKEFISRHGHLRPGTYEITVPSYRESSHYFDNASSNAKFSAPPTDGLDDDEWVALARALRDLDLPDDIGEVKTWMRRAMEGRERAKHVFTKNVSAALDLIARFGTDIGLDRDTLSFVGLFDLQTVALGGGLTACRDWLVDRATQNRAAHQNAMCVELPPVIASVQDFRIFRHTESHPSFVGLGCAVAEPVVPDRTMGPMDIAGKIVMLLSADPGYDWVFACGPVGLVTAYGGANSHMTIRAAELNLPAAIGVGEPRFEDLRAASLLLLDGAGCRIQVLR
jgi:hypothetical protein